MIDRDLARGDGRTVRVRTAGADAGPLIVYLHGSPSSRLDIDDVDDRSRSRGVRLAAFDRPGYGGSTFAPFSFDSIADDVYAVADHAGAETFMVVGQSSGAPYALATAALRPERLTAVATGGGAATFGPDVPWWDTLSDGEKQGVALIGVDDAEAERLLAEADEPSMASLDLDDRAFLSHWRGQFGPADQRYVDGPYGPRLAATVRESLRQGQAGWARDNLVRMGTWPFDPGRIRCRVTLWYGEQDNWAAGKWVADRVPNAELHVLPDRGHLALFEEWDQVLDDLAIGLS
jgi:pimeloyl-ACP methyl ester carboxylesterase